MKPNEDQARLSRISTVWTDLDIAHRSVESEQASARSELLERYGKAVYRYLLAGSGIRIWPRS